MQTNIMTLSESLNKYKKYILVSTVISMLFAVLVCVTFFINYDSHLTLFNRGTSVLPMCLLGILSAAFMIFTPCTMDTLHLPSSLPRTKGAFAKISSLLLSLCTLLSSVFMVLSKSERYSAIMNNPTEYEKTASIALTIAVVAFIPSAFHFVLVALDKYSVTLSACFTVSLLAFAFYNFYDPMIIITNPLRVLTLISYCAIAFCSVQEIKIRSGRPSVRLYIASCCIAMMLPLASSLTKLVLIFSGNIMLGASLPLAGLELFFALYTLSHLLVFFDYDEFSEIYKYSQTQEMCTTAISEESGCKPQNISNQENENDTEELKDAKEHDDADSDSNTDIVADAEDKNDEM